MTLADLKDFYTANFTSFSRMALACMPKEWGGERREEATQAVMAGVWRTLQRLYVVGDLNAENVYWMAKRTLYFGVRQVLGGREMPQAAEHGQRGKNRNDAYDRMPRIELSVSFEFLVGTTPVADAVAFRLDFAACLETLSDRDRQIIACMIAGFGTGEIAERFGLSPGRISQLRASYKVLIETYFNL